MKLDIVIKYADILTGRRILVTSDIHGHITHFKGVLEKAGFSEDDLLVIAGDIIEKGPESLATLRYVMELYKKGNVIALAGNVDMWRVQMLDDLNADNAAEFLDYLRRMRAWKGTSFFDEMTRELGFVAESPDELIKSKEHVAFSFQKELGFLRALPTVLETKNYTFVHGGLPDKDLAALKSRSVYDLLKYDNFMCSEIFFDKYIVAGHWPVTLYDKKIARANPIINRGNKIIAIDGGCGLKRDGQLNMLVIPGIDCPIDEVYHTSYDEFPICMALSSQNESKDSINICWLDNKIKVLETERDFTYAEHIGSGRRLWIYNEYIMNNSTRCDDYTDYVLAVNKGDKLSLVKETSKGYIVKKNGVTGWYYGEVDKV